MRTLFAALLLVAPVAAQPGPPGSPTKDGPTIAVKGRVMDREAKRPVRGARVAMRSGRSEIATTFSDFQGRWEIAAAPVGEWSIDVAKSGYDDRARRIVVPTAGPLTGIDLDLSKSGVIAGRVLDAERRPMVGANVVALLQQDTDGERSYTGRSGAGSFNGRVDDRGEYRLHGLRPGRYALAVTPDARPGAAGEIWLRHGPTFAPGVRRIEDATHVEIGPGTVLEGIDVIMLPAEPTHVIGKTVAAQGKCANCNVLVMVRAQGAYIQAGRTRVASEGAFSVRGLPPGDYLVVVRGWDEKTRDMISASEPVSVLRDQPVAVVVEVAEAISVPVRVVLRDPPEDVVGESVKPWRPQLSLSPIDDNWEVSPRTRGMFATGEASSGLESTAELRAYAGKYRLALRGLEGAYIETVEQGSRPIQPNELKIPAGGFDGGLTVRVAFQRGTLQGTVDETTELVTAGLKQPQLGLFLSPVDAWRGIRLHHYGQVQPDGTFSEQVPPGEYDAVVMVPGQYGGRGREPARSTILKPFRKRVVIKADETTEVELEVPKDL